MSDSSNGDRSWRLNFDGFQLSLEHTKKQVKPPRGLLDCYGVLGNFWNLLTQIFTIFFSSWNRNLHFAFTLVVVVNCGFCFAVMFCSIFFLYSSYVYCVPFALKMLLLDFIQCAQQYFMFFFSFSARFSNACQNFEVSQVYLVALFFEIWTDDAVIYIYIQLRWVFGVLGIACFLRAAVGRWTIGFRICKLQRPEAKLFFHSELTFFFPVFGFCVFRGRGFIELMLRFYI